jgi:hypothetical protein
VLLSLWFSKLVSYLLLGGPCGSRAKLVFDLERFIMSAKKFVRYVSSLGFTGVEFVEMLSTDAALLTYSDLDAKTIRGSLGRSARHEENLFVFTPSRDRAIRVNTKKKRIWLGNGKPMTKKFLESVTNA